MDDRPATRGGFDARYLAFLSTVTALRPKLHRYCARMTGSVLDGEDVVQDTLFEAYRHLDDYDEARPIGPWLFRIAHNRCIDFLRRQEARGRAEHAAAEPAIVAAADPAGPALGRAVERLVHRLPPKERACVLLKDVFDYTIDEIADLVESTPGGVKAALHRGREKLAASSPVETSESRAVPAETARVLRLYVERFNERDWDGLRDLIAADATLRVADRFSGPFGDSPYFSRYARIAASLTAVLSDVDGEPAIVLYAHLDGATHARTFVRVTVADDRIVEIADYTHCEWVMAAASSVSPTPPPA
jgi:RNA polymerase sigma-70 factor (ECF subfamily)